MNQKVGSTMNFQAENWNFSNLQIFLSFSTVIRYQSPVNCRHLTEFTSIEIKVSLLTELVNLWIFRLAEENLKFEN